MGIKVRVRLPAGIDASSYAIAAAAHILLALAFIGIGQASSGTGKLGPALSVRLSGRSGAPAGGAAKASAPHKAAPRPAEPAPPKGKEPKPTKRVLAEPQPKTIARKLSGATAQPPALPKKTIEGSPESEPSDTDRPSTAAGAGSAAKAGIPGLPEGPIAGGIAGALGDDAVGADWYARLVVNRLEDGWRDRPLLPSGTESRRVIVSFVIERDGRVTEVGLQAPSGYTPLDTSALRAVSSLGKLPPLPREYGKDRLRARFVFELTPPA